MIHSHRSTESYDVIGNALIVAGTDNTFWETYISTNAGFLNDFAA